MLFAKFVTYAACRFLLNRKGGAFSGNTLCGVFGGITIGQIQLQQEDIK